MEHKEYFKKRGEVLNEFGLKFIDGFYLMDPLARWLVESITRGMTYPEAIIYLLKDRQSMIKDFDEKLQMSPPKPISIPIPEWVNKDDYNLFIKYFQSNINKGSGESN